MAWITVAGKDDPELEKEVSNRSAERVSSGQYSAETPGNVAKLGAGVIADRKEKTSSVSLTDEEIEVLRRLCQSFDVELRPLEISSHRPLIGPIIVTFKKILFRILRPLLEPVIRQQRDFNSSVIALFLESKKRA